jgi:integrase/recombinase XerD
VLRRSELLNLKFSDIDSKKKYCPIKNAKGKKIELHLWVHNISNASRILQAYKPKLAFEGQVRGQRYSEKSLQSILKQALQKIDIKNQSPTA